MPRLCLARRGKIRHDAVAFHSSLLRLYKAERLRHLASALSVTKGATRRAVVARGRGGGATLSSFSAGGRFLARVSGTVATLCRGGWVGGRLLVMVCCLDDKFRRDVFAWCCGDIVLPYPPHLSGAAT